MTVALCLVPDEPEELMIEPGPAFWRPDRELPMAAAERRKIERAARVIPKTDEERRLLAARTWRHPLRVRTPVEGAGDLLAYRAPVRRAPRRAPAARPKRVPMRTAPKPAKLAPVRPAGLRVVPPAPPPPPARQLGDDITLPRSRRRKVAVPRRMIAGESPESLGDVRLTDEERAEMDLEVAAALAAGETFGPPADDRDCPAGPCPRVSCRHNLYIEISGKFTTLNFPGLHIDEVPETCSLRVATAARERRDESRRQQEPAMSCAEIGQYLNLTPETIRKDLKAALAKLRAAGVALK